jgi:hypothetical protein
MAIDTESKRRSVQAYHIGQMRPVADGTISEADRATVTWLYHGLNYDSPVVGTGQNYFRKFITTLRRRISS